MTDSKSEVGYDFQFKVVLIGMSGSPFSDFYSTYLIVNPYSISISTKVQKRIILSNLLLNSVSHVIC